MGRLSCAHVRPHDRPQQAPQRAARKSGRNLVAFYGKVFPEGVGTRGKGGIRKNPFFGGMEAGIKGRIQ